MGIIGMYRERVNKLSGKINVSFILILVSIDVFLFTQHILQSFIGVILPLCAQNFAIFLFES